MPPRSTPSTCGSGARADEGDCEGGEIAVGAACCVSCWVWFTDVASCGLLSLPGPALWMVSPVRDRCSKSCGGGVGGIANAGGAAGGVWVMER